MSRIAVFPGSFNPFTIGHLSILQRALPLFDKVYVAVGLNNKKAAGNVDMEKLVDGIKKAVEKLPGDVEVIAYYGLTVNVARDLGARFILRGIRSVTDFEYEKNLADINRNISGIETVFICSLPEYSWISSSALRELESFGHDITPYLP